MYVDWEYYKIFYYVAKYQNFTKAARVLGNNQPNITHSMNRLEIAKNCTVCGVEYVPGSGASRYCPACAKKIRREIGRASCRERV